MPRLYFDPVFLRHETGDHPESAQRVLPALERIEELDPEGQWRRASWQAASNETLALVHDPNYVTAIEQACRGGGKRLDADTVVSSYSFAAATAASGAVVDAVDQVLTTSERQAFCLVRPPGHHALAGRAMGFCLFNHIAVAAKAALRLHGLSRVMIVDWDVHHGNGTQDLFWTDEQVGFLSIHRYPFYPGSGAADETGSGAALGTKLNVPIRYGTLRPEFLERFARSLEDLAARIRPELVLISCGFDAHRHDPIGSLGLEADDFAPLTELVLQVARQYAGARVVSMLEGGYDPLAVADCLDIHLRTLFELPEAR
jgi:acetoin utilization deacetylase AcuC-like enzyme